ncbi:alpha/beta hydrolase [Pelotomaculum isophthalicicum JI]|uniref:Alpha/beta hydrolase n=1 Tax=Pelotomaculum isophthalicicum JI TaxID=947010 RepID=A0A9X4H257_9FIRM|nr:alpha/beta hydrolase [Pelotomaculum isophthalicicum]MDF9408676.1 alpha/beta hydrolase [Pelotomaculum isophthalicicum JI]
MPYCELDNVQYFYYERNPEKTGGVGKTIVFVHGAGGNGSYWTKQLTGLGSNFRVIAPDLPGHGKSAGTSCDSIKAYREFLNKFAAKVIDGGFYLAGHSMGGAVVLDFSLNHPEMLAGVILIATSAKFSAINAILEMLKNGRHNHELVDLVYSKNALPQFRELALREINSVSPVVWFRDFSACKYFDVTSRLSEIQLPALIMTGTGDLLTPLQYARLLECGLPCARLVEIEGAGHMLMLEKPGIVNKHIIDFISSK